MGKNKQKQKHKQRPPKFSEAQWANKGIPSPSTALPCTGSQKRVEDQVLPQETLWADDSSPRSQETIAGSPTRRDIEEAEAEVATEWNVGDVILDLYEVKGVLGEGGFGKVFRVRHKGWNIDLAVKTPRIDRLDKAGKENFRNEAETWVNLGLHPHTVSCYYVRDLGGIPRVFAEFVEGGSLSEWIRTRKLYEGGKDEALKRIMDVAIQFAWGLQCAHEQGLVHQDVKPANVMMTSEGVAKVTDFGLARARGVASADGSSVAGQSVLVESGGMTPAYASPEQSLGKPLSRATDIWSWAVSVFEMFTGEVTWMSGLMAAEILELHLQSDLEDHTIPEIPTALVDLFRLCFGANPSDRPQDMLRVADILQEIYHAKIGAPYSRRLPKPGRALADSLNNRAVSLIDLGKKEDAERQWEEALRVEPNHPESTYNFGLHLWREGKLDDEELLQRINQSSSSQVNTLKTADLQALVHLERGDITSALKILDKDEVIEAGQNVLTNALAVAEKHRATRVRLFCKLEGPKRGYGLMYNGDCWSGYQKVKSVALSYDGRHAITACSDATLKLWDVTSGLCIRTFGPDDGHTAPIKSVVLSRDGRFALSGSDDKSVKLWDVRTGRSLKNLQCEAAVESVFLTFDGKYAMSGSGDQAQMWNLESGDCVHTLQYEYEAWGVKLVKLVNLSHDGRYILGSNDGNITLWEATTGRQLNSLNYHHQVPGASDVCLSADGRHAVMGDGTAFKLCDVGTGHCVRTFNCHAQVLSVCLSEDEHYALVHVAELLLADPEGMDKYGRQAFKLWDLRAGRCLFTYRASELSGRNLCAFGRYAVLASDAGIELWDIRISGYVAPMVMSGIVTSESVVETDAEYDNQMTRAHAAYENEQFALSANCLWRARSQPGHERDAEAVNLWSRLYTRLPRKSLQGGWKCATPSVAVGSSISLSCDGRYVLCLSHDLNRVPVELREVETGRCLRTFGQPGAHLEAVTQSRDSKWALSFGDNEVVLWDTETGDRRMVGKHYTRTVSPDENYWRNFVYLSQDQRFALSLSGASRPQSVIKLWDLSANVCVRTLENPTIWENQPYPLLSLSVSRDERYILCGGPELKLWDIASGREHVVGPSVGRNVVMRDGPRPLTDAVHLKLAALSPDGRYALSLAWGAEELMLWEVSTGCCVRTFRIEPEEESFQTESATEKGFGWVNPSFSEDGRYAVSCGYEHSVALWEVETGRCLRVFEGHTRRVTAVALSPDLRYIMSAGNDGTKVWFLDWELEEREPLDWDEGARPYLETFLLLHTPYIGSLQSDRESSEQDVTLWLTRRGNPIYTEQDFQQLLYDLSCVGYGWLRPEGVRRELEKMAEELGTNYSDSNQHGLDAITPEASMLPPANESRCRATTAEDGTTNRSWWERIWKS